MIEPTPRILVTGATGYIGGRLVPRLLEKGWRVGVLVRDSSRIRGRPWAEQVEIIEGNLLDEGGSWISQVAGYTHAYYLVHSMIAGRGFPERDRQAARHFAEALHGSAIHVIYLGGLLPEAGSASSDHLRSRAETGDVLRSLLPVTEFRAGPIIGSGSASFEMVRYLTDRLPIMVAPRWICNEVQTIAVRDILNYLVTAIGRPPSGIVEVGAAPVTFKQMMLEYAAERGYGRIIMPLPVLAPGLAARWVSLVTPISNKIAIPLIEGILHPLRADTRRAEELFPEIEPADYRTGVRRALAKVERRDVETRWSGALTGSTAYRLEDREGLIREVRQVACRASPAELFAAFSSIGGREGWLVWGWAWTLRGILDTLVGGPGLRRGRRDPEEIFTGEALDFWRVEEAEPGERLLLRAEMKVPGRAWLMWEAAPGADSRGSRLVQTALFQPKGLAGTLYWHSLYFLHKRIFSDLARAVARRAEQRMNQSASKQVEAGSPAQASTAIEEGSGQTPGALPEIQPRK